MDEILDKIIEELVESDLTAYDLKTALEIIEKYREKVGD